MSLLKFDESGLSFRCSGRSAWRQADLPSYKQLSGLKLKECDLSFYSSAQNIIWHIELKGKNGLHRESDKGYAERIVGPLVEKTADMLLMMTLTRFSHGVGFQMKSELPEEVRRKLSTARHKFLMFVDLPSESIPLLNQLQDDFRKRLRRERIIYGLHESDLVLSNYDYLLKKLSDEIEVSRVG